MSKECKSIVVVGILLVTTNSFAGVFGPSNYEECVLDKMKGQTPNMMSLAKAACLKAFPDEPTENVIPQDLIKYTWCKSEYNSVAVCIEQAPPKAKITKVEGVFFEDACDAALQPKPGVKATAEKPWYGTTYKFELPPAKRGCAYFTFYGVEK